MKVYGDTSVEWCSATLNISSYYINVGNTQAALKLCNNLGQLIIENRNNPRFGLLLPTLYFSLYLIKTKEYLDMKKYRGQVMYPTSAIPLAKPEKPGYNSPPLHQLYTANHKGKLAFQDKIVGSSLPPKGFTNESSGDHDADCIIHEERERRRALIRKYESERQRDGSANFSRGYDANENQKEMKRESLFSKHQKMVQEEREKELFESRQKKIEEEREKIFEMAKDASDAKNDADEYWSLAMEMAITECKFPPIRILSVKDLKEKAGDTINFFFGDSNAKIKRTSEKSISPSLFLSSSSADSSFTPVHITFPPAVLAEYHNIPALLCKMKAQQMRKDEAKEDDNDDSNEEKATEGDEEDESKPTSVSFYNKSLGWLFQSLLLQELAAKKRWSDYADTLTLIGQVMEEMGRMDEAEEYLREAYECLVEKYTPISVRTLSAATLLCQHLVSKGVVEEAFHLLGNAIAAFEEEEQMLPIPALTRALRVYTSILLHQKQFEMAELTARRVIQEEKMIGDIQREDEGNDEKEGNEKENKIEREKKAESSSYSLKKSIVDVAPLNEDHPLCRVADGYKMLGRAFYGQERYTEARKAFQRSKRFYSRILGKDAIVVQKIEEIIQCLAAMFVECWTQTEDVDEETLYDAYGSQNAGFD
ncbi:uncharacterized protein MONOS_1431 [Monocercomonoides exilis]|uniref:uncharacterized protein n=1 Tax=Monocercomonoides exilis TaxID=2049356 RepID=UPI0035594F04|nr:hypothetical protein MONOS_1431 [Monocercomonoides exilis]|eukprot:MONOS_1431.1-p1 / transcript=MONOS_1431.1 / gene=MONOS_1431 / organism=Monocercomonoides_exilis_PA203 / gene_product=unspecified product / transcript_product=unspecified product / location=Mono_scaffold00025:125612-127898(-) / protein_length=649 / sequence_SO=supercontig / SO=protein_coding / is_pseudo=false